LSAVALVFVPAAMSVKGLVMLDIYGLNGTISTYGFLVAYILIAVGAMASVARQRASRAGVIVAGLVGILFMGLAVVGSVYPWAAVPYNTLPPVFAVYMAIGVGWMIYDRRRMRASADPAAGK